LVGSPTGPALSAPGRTAATPVFGIVSLTIPIVVDPIATHWRDQWILFVAIPNPGTPWIEGKVHLAVLVVVQLIATRRGVGWVDFFIVPGCTTPRVVGKVDVAVAIIIEAVSTLRQFLVHAEFAWIGDATAAGVRQVYETVIVVIDPVGALGADRSIIIRLIGIFGRPTARVCGKVDQIVHIVVFAVTAFG